MISRTRFLRTIIATLILSTGFTLTAEAALSVPTPSASKGKNSGYVKLTWSKVSKSKGYIIRRGTSSTYAKSSILKKISSASTTSFKDTTAKAGKKYYYWVCPRSSSTKYWYNTGRYAYGYRKGSVTTSYVSGPSSLSYGSRGTYYLYIKGKKITSKKLIKWSKSGTTASLFNYGYYARLIPDNVFSSSPVTIKATYSGKTYSKKVTIKGVVPVPDPVWHYCSQHGWVKVPPTYIGCPYCKGEINW